ncbi:hypothetical protein FRB93_011042 [Tulasnella sp. JGI-2019a]|nr:hypothetical protein FRB93_011042 [Tulasnella sp. JGI-2019a]
MDLPDNDRDRQALRAALETLGTHHIDYNQLQIDMDSPLGRGGFGVVRRALFDDQMVAVKILRSDESRDIRVAKALIREMKIWSRLSHQNVLRLIGFYLSQTLDCAIIVCPLAPHGSLQDYVQRESPGDAFRLRLAQDTLNGLVYLHGLNPPVTHGDIKAANALVNQELRAMLSDFGLALAASEVPSGLTTSHGLVGSVRWCSPELMKDAPRSTSSDIWAWGVLLVEVMKEYVPYSWIKAEPAVILEMTKGVLPQPKSRLISPVNLWSVTRLCWKPSPEKRATAIAVLKALGTLISTIENEGDCMDDLQNSIEMLSWSVRALNRTDCDELGPALDKLLNLVIAVKKAKFNGQNLTAALTRLHEKFLHKISPSRDFEVRFSPATIDFVVQLSSQITKAADEAFSKKAGLWRSLDPSGPQIVANGLNKAMDDFEKANLKISVIKSATTVVSVTTAEPFQQSAEDISAQCPRFRILVLGKSGTGRSTLINRVFNVNTATVSPYIPGVSNIDDEITSPENPRFILHDSQGFESGEGKNLAIVRDFLRRRGALATRDQVHAVWLCVQCPNSNDRVIETVDEDFLGEDFGLPVILVFTKYDLLLDAKECEAREDYDGDDYDEDKIAADGSKLAEEEYKRSCIKPLDRIRGTKIQHARVSIYSKDSLNNLVELTGQFVCIALAKPLQPHGDWRSA